jgi:hypothetical protein
MDAVSIQKSIQSTVMSLQMEGLSVKDEYIELCRRMLSGEITMKEYIACVTPHEAIRNEL